MRGMVRGGERAIEGEVRDLGEKRGKYDGVVVAFMYFPAEESLLEWRQ